jgi:hypothetical protein
MSASEERNCRECCFSRVIDDCLRCARNAPAVDADTGLARWPVVEKDDTCGCFRYGDADYWARGELAVWRDGFGDYCRVPLGRGRFAKVDPEDYVRLTQFKWHCHVAPHTCYAVRTQWQGNKSKKILMHRVVAETPRHLVCDHINRDGLDNRWRNLRNCTKAQNNLNRGSERGSTSKYKGVYWHKSMKKWVATIKAGGRRRHLGYFTDEVEAAGAYDAAAKELHGEHAGLNF